VEVTSGALKVKVGGNPEVYEASRSNLKHQAFGRLRLRGQVDAWFLRLKPPSFWGITLSMVYENSPTDTCTPSLTASLHGVGVASISSVELCRRYVNQYLQ